MGIVNVVVVIISVCCGFFIVKNFKEFLELEESDLDDI